MWFGGHVVLDLSLDLNRVKPGFVAKTLTARFLGKDFGHVPNSTWFNYCAALYL